MDDITSQMSAVLGNPEMMQKIMAMAQSLNQSSPETPQEAQQTSPNFSMPDIDLATIQKISGFFGKSKIDNNQQTLLNALTPSLSHNRIAKLEKAMRAAKLATLASSFLNSQSLQFNLGR